MSDPDHTGEILENKQGLLIQHMLSNLQAKADAWGLGVVVTHDNRQDSWFQILERVASATLAEKEGVKKQLNERRKSLSLIKEQL